MKNEHDEIEGERDPLLERLVAHLLGELSAEEAAAVEAELERSAELRARAATLRGTIGLVQGLSAEAPSLSAAAREPLTAAERGAGGVAGGGNVIQGPWYRRASVRAAAGVLIVVSAAVAYRATRGGLLGPETVEGSLPDLAQAQHRSASAPQAEGATVALRDAQPAPKEQQRGSAAVSETRGETPLGNPALEKLESLGYLGGAGSAAAGAQADGAQPPRTSSVALGGGGGGGGSAFVARSAAPPPGSPAPRAATGLVAGSGGTPPPAEFEALGYLDSASSSERTVGVVLRELGYVEAGQAPADELLLFEAPGAASGVLERVAASDGDREDARLYESPNFDKEVLGEDDFYAGLQPRPSGLSPAELEAERAMLDRLGLEPARLGEALEALGYVSGADDLELDSPEGYLLRRKVVQSQVVRERVETLIQSCRRAPGESLQDMIFRHWGTRPFTDAGVDALSTFAIDTDTASYTLARGMFERGILPEAAQIRTEEFVNYFDPEVPAPREATFAITTELGASPFGRAQGQPQDTLLMRVVVRAKDVSLEERTPLALTFVVDVSGSMDTDNRIGLVKDALGQLLTRLDGRDRVAIVAFSNEARVALEPTPANQRGRLEAAIAGLATGGGTNADAGLVLGYGLAGQGFDASRNNRVVFLSDGVANIGDTDKAAMIAKTAEARAKGVYLNTVGFGIGNHNDALLEQLADDGDGVCNYVDSPVEARKAFVENFTGSFETVARDAKIQVEFDPARVGSYRLLGYENRAIADREFRQDAVDAGEVQAGRAAVALYELRDVDLSEGPLATVRVRYKQPFDAGREVGEEAGALELSRDVTGEGTVFEFGAASTGFRKAALVAQVAEVLRRSLHARGDSMAELAVQIERLADQTSDPDFREFATLFASNRAAIEALVQPATEGSGLLDELKYLQLELEREREAEGQPDPGVIAGLEARIAEAEDRMRQLAFGGSDR